MVFTIIYNPYLQKTMFLKNGFKLEDNSNLMQMTNEKIQNWFKIKTNYLGFFDELQSEFKNKQIAIEFWGRACDFRDFKTYINSFDSQGINLMEPVLIEDEISFIKEIFTFVKAMEKNDKLSESLSRTFDKIYCDMFKICVIATMSSGKSTLINAMLGRDLLPSNTAACTATITTMTDNDNMETFDVKCFDEDGSVLIEKNDITLEDLEAFNEDDSIKKIELEGPIPGITCSNFKLHLIDTPGPNNSTNVDHEELTIEIVESDDYAMVIYVMSPTTIQSDDNNELFEIIAKEMEKKGKEAQERFLFVLNKCDELDPEDEDDTIESVIEIAKKYLIEKGIENPKMFPVTAELAKLLRMKEMGHKITKKDHKEIKSWITSFEEYEDESVHKKLICFEQYASLSSHSKEKIEQRLTQAKNDEDYELQALIHTGVPALEETIEEYLEKTVYPMKIKEFVEHADHYLKGNVLSSALETYFLERLTQEKRKSKLLKRIEIIIDTGSDPFAGNISDAMMNPMLMDLVKRNSTASVNKEQVFKRFTHEKNVIVQMINSDGLIIVNEDYCKYNPVGIKSEKLITMKETGLKYFGSEGIRYKVLKNLESKLDLNDVTKIIWMPKDLKQEIQESLDCFVCENASIENFSQMICDEEIATDAKELLFFTRKQNHPIFESMTSDKIRFLDELQLKKTSTKKITLIDPETIDFAKSSHLKSDNKDQVTDLFTQDKNVIIQMINSDGLIIINEDYCENNPVGIKNEKLISMKETGSKYFGSEGFRYKILKNQESKLVPKDISKIIWMPKGLKLEMQENLDYLMYEHESIDNFSQMICDETIERDAESLLLFVKKQNHPIFEGSSKDR